MNGISKPEDIRRVASGFQQSRVLLTAFELKIFTLLEEKGKTAADLAEIIGADTRALSRLLNALCTMELLRKVRDIYFNTEISSRCLVEGREEYMGNLGHSNHTYHKWTSLTNAVRKGSMQNYSEINERGSDWLEAFIEAMHYRGVKQADILSKMIYLEDAKKMLDIGGGSGAFTMGFLKAFPNLEGVIFDLPNVIPLTKQYVKNAGFDSRVSYMEGNFMRDSLGTNYDFIFLSAIVHMNSYEDNKLLVQKCADALNPGGKITIMDFVMNENRTEPKHGAFFALNMLVATKEGDTYTENEITEWYEAAGLKLLSSTNTPFGTGVITAEKI